MEVFLRILQTIINFIYFFVHPLLALVLPRKKGGHVIPAIKNKLLTVALVDVVSQIRQRKLSSQQLVDAYIERAKEVNPYINAIVEDRFKEATKEAKRADELISKCSNNMEQLQKLFSRYPLLGVPFSVKESCGLKGMSQVVGSLKRCSEKSSNNGAAVEMLRASGAIPLLVSANPEYCFSIETNTYTNGKCLNPYDARRTSGGSSGGEGALNGAGATLFGLGSDIGGSIRIPSLFNGVFGHKPTGGVTSINGHFPHSSDPDCANYLQVGPITRFARDLCLIVSVLAGAHADKMELSKPVETKTIKIHYALGFTHLNGLLHQPVAFDIKLCIMKAVKYFEEMGLTTQRVNIPGFRNSTEISFSAIARLEDFPYLINATGSSQILVTLKECARSIIGKSEYTKDGLIFELMRRANAFMPKKNLDKYKKEAEELKSDIVKLLGHNGVLFFPTFHVPAVHHNSSFLPLWGIDYALIFNVLGLPATHIPIGLDSNGLPIGFQVIAAPYQDKLCLQIAEELESAFGGWVPPTPHQF